ncbi:MAG: hypothetical protein QF391_15020, partial [Myxococcota bacterium]|nr:hypothetical protein [Myxococcota bacterium]
MRVLTGAWSARTPVLELLDQVLLVAAVVGFEDHLCGGEAPVVGDVEEVAYLVEESLLATLNRQVLSQNHDAVGPVAGGGAVVELRQVLGAQPNILVPLGANDLLLDALRAGATLVLLDKGALGAALQFLVVGVGKIASLRREVLPRIVAEDKADPLLGPAVEVLGLGEVCVASEQDVDKAGATAQSDGLVQIV